MIEGCIPGTPWVSFSSNLEISEAEAAEMYANWRASRDANGHEFKYRLVKRVTAAEVLQSE